jgi:hypothetical protein
MKFIMPLLLIAFSGFAQDAPKLDAPKLDPNTGLPITNVTGRDAKFLADVLQGATRKRVQFIVIDRYDNLPDILEESLNAKMELGMKRNKLINEINRSPVEWSKIVISVGKIGSGFTWDVSILRSVKTHFGDDQIVAPARFTVYGAYSSNAANLKDKLDSVLDRIYLAYLKLPESNSLERVKVFSQLLLRANKGDPKAQYEISDMFYRGAGVAAIDYKRALKYMRMAAEQGYAPAQAGMGNFYSIGLPVVDQYILRPMKIDALEWYLKAANQGHLEPVYRIVKLYQTGEELVPQDRIAAYAWADIARQAGISEAKGLLEHAIDGEYLDKIKDGKIVRAKKMTSDQIAKGKALAKDMIKKNPRLLKD